MEGAFQGDQQDFVARSLRDRATWGKSIAACRPKEATGRLLFPRFLR